MTMPGGSLGTTAGRRGRSRDSLDGLSHRHFSTTVDAAGGQVLFNLPCTVARIEDVAVYVAGVRQRIDVPGTNYAYGVRGLTAGIPGDSNAIVFHAAPGAGADVTIDAIGG